MLPLKVWADQKETCLQAAERKAITMGLTVSQDAAEERPVTCNFKVDKGALPAIAENGALSTQSSPQKEVRSPLAQFTSLLQRLLAMKYLQCLPACLPCCRALVQSSISAGQWPFSCLWHHISCCQR